MRNDFLPGGVLTVLRISAWPSKKSVVKEIQSLISSSLLKGFREKLSNWMVIIPGLSQGLCL